MASTTWDPANKSADITLSNADLTATKTAASYANVRSVLGVNSGKWYWELTFDDEGPGYTVEEFGVGDNAIALGTSVGFYSTGYSYKEDGQKGNNNSYVAFGSAFNVGDIISIALDMDAGKVWWALNGVWQASGDPGAGTNEAYSGISGTYYAWITLYDDTAAVTANFGASAFSHSVPSGFVAGLGRPTLYGEISEDVNITSEFEDNFGELNEDVNVNSEFACLVADVLISENASVNSELSYFESDVLISEDASVNSEFIAEHTGELSEDASVNSGIDVIKQSIVELSEDTSVNSEFVCYQRPANLDAELPMVTADILGGQGGFLDATLPLITVDIKSGAILEASLPAITASLEGKVGAVGNINAVLPSLIADIEGKVETLGDIDAILPVLRASIKGKTGDLATCAATLPMLLADIQGVNDLSGDIDATLPLIKPYMVGTVERESCEVLRYSR